MSDLRATSPDERGLEIVHVDDHDHLREIGALLDEAERDAGLPLVDESEQERLAQLAGGHQRDERWRSVLLRRDGRAIAYGSVVAQDQPGAGGSLTGDVAVRRPVRDAAQVTVAALHATAEAAARLGGGRLEVWMRAVGPVEVVAAEEAGFEVARRLEVLGRPLPVPENKAVPAVAGATVRAFQPDEDDAEVVRVLAAAYAGTEDAGWDLDVFRQRRAWSWFRPEDLLVADLGDGRLGGLHWLKRRRGAVGEVYNLAIDPAAQGRGLGPLLLHAGLEHLTSVGCREVILWVDTVNERAVSLYRRNGFTTRWQDLAVSREVAG